MSSFEYFSMLQSFPLSLRWVYPNWEYRRSQLRQVVLNHHLA
jgi:hypothetical protein